MKKQLIAKLLVLGMVLAMLPVTAIAASVIVDPGDVVDNGDNTYSYTDKNGVKHEVTYNPDDDTYRYEDDTAPSTPVFPAPDGSNSSTDTQPDETKPAETEDPAETEEPAEAEPVVVEKVDDVKTETNENGQTVVTATVAVEDKTAPVAVSEAAVEALVSQAKEGDVVAIVAETTGAVTAPAAQLAKLIEATGNPVSVGNSVASVAVNAALVELAGGAEVVIAPVENDDGTISVPVMAGGKEIAPESVPGGIDVEVPVSYTADEVSGVNAVKADETEVELSWSITIGKLQVNLTVSGSIKIIKK